MLVNTGKDTFISDRANNCCFTNLEATKQITFYLPKCLNEKVFRFFVATPKKVLIQINNEEDQFWASPKKTLVLPAIPGVEVTLECLLSKWQTRSNSPLTFR